MTATWINKGKKENGNGNKFQWGEDLTQELEYLLFWMGLHSL